MLGDIGQYKPKRKRIAIDLSTGVRTILPDTPSKESDGNPPVLDLMTPPSKIKDVLDLITPEKNPRKESADSVTPTTNRQLYLEEKDTGDGTTGLSKETATDGDEGTKDDQDDTAKTTGRTGSSNNGDGSPPGSTSTGANSTSGAGGDDNGDDDHNGSDDGDKDNSTPPKPKKGKENKRKDSAKKDDDASVPGKDQQDVPAVSGIILPFVDHTGITKRNP
jgi:hypothetical protein